MFPFYEGLQLKICVFLLTFKLPKPSPLNQGYQHDAQSVCLQRTPQSVKVLPPSHSCRKRLASAASRKASRQAFCPVAGLRGGTLASGGSWFSLVPAYVHTASPNCAECLQNKDDTNCWMWRVWFYSRNEAVAAVMMLQKMEITRFTNVSGCRVFTMRGNSRLCSRVQNVDHTSISIVLQSSSKNFTNYRFKQIMWNCSLP